MGTPDKRGGLLPLLAIKQYAAGKAAVPEWIAVIFYSTAFPKIPPGPSRSRKTVYISPPETSQVGFFVVDFRRNATKPHIRGPPPLDLFSQLQQTGGISYGL